MTVIAEPSDQASDLVEEAREILTTSLVDLVFRPDLPALADRLAAGAPSRLHA